MGHASRNANRRVGQCNKTWIPPPDERILYKPAFFLLDEVLSQQHVMIILDLYKDYMRHFWQTRQDELLPFLEKWFNKTVARQKIVEKEKLFISCKCQALQLDLQQLITTMPHVKFLAALWLYLWKETSVSMPPPTPKIVLMVAAFLLRGNCTTRKPVLLFIGLLQFYSLIFRAELDRINYDGTFRIDTIPSGQDEHLMLQIAYRGTVLDSINVVSFKTAMRNLLIGFVHRHLSSTS